MRWWPFGKREQAYTPVDDVVAAYLNAGVSGAGTVVGETSTLGLSGAYRAVALIAGTIGQLPLRTIRTLQDGSRERVASVFDNPDGPYGQTRFEWVETMLLHLLLHGNAFLRHRETNAGTLHQLQLVHPLRVHVRLPDARDNPQPVGGKWFDVSYDDGATDVGLDAISMTHISGPSTDGVQGLSPITVARLSFGTAIAGDQAAARVFRSGALISGLVTPDDDLEGEEVTEIRKQLNQSIGGVHNAGSIAVVNRKLKFTPWSMTAADAQFLQSRQFSIEEIARWFGVPPHLLMQTSKQTSWGSGVAEQNEGLARYTLSPWTVRIEQRLSRLLASPRSVEFDYAGLTRPTYAEETRLLIEQTGGPIALVNEARAVRNLPPVEGGDVLRSVPGAAAPPAAAGGPPVDEQDDEQTEDDPDA